MIASVNYYNYITSNKVPVVLFVTLPFALFRLMGVKWILLKIKQHITKIQSGVFPNEKTVENDNNLPPSQFFLYTAETWLRLTCCRTVTPADQPGNVNSSLLRREKFASVWIHRRRQPLPETRVRCVMSHIYESHIPALERCRSACVCVFNHQLSATCSYLPAAVV